MNDKKIAVLISGEYREFEIAHKSWEFINNPNVDFYFSTWEVSTQKNDKLGIQVKENITESVIRKYLPNCKNIDIGSSSLLKMVNKTNNQRMVNRWLKSIEMVEASGIHYDICIVIRPDLFLTYNSDVFYKFLDTIEDNCLYLLSDPSIGYWVQDFMLIATKNSITNLMKLPINELEEEKNIHTWLAKELVKIFSSIHQIKGIIHHKTHIVRPNSRNKVVDARIIMQDSEKWYRSLHSKDIVIKEFSGFSGSKVVMIKSLNDFIIRKTDNVERNYEKLKILAFNNFLVPRIIDKEGNILDMEYIQGHDMKSFLELEDTRLLVKFVVDTMNRFKEIDSGVKDYTSTYAEQLEYFKEDIHLPFKMDELLEKLPKILPSSLCHGDFTLDNIIYKEPNFYMIDPSTGVHDSWIFDIAKLRQDLDGKWFLRNTNRNNFNIELSLIKKELYEAFPEAFNDYLYILMLLRVYKYSKEETLERDLLLKELNRLWK